MNKETGGSAFPGTQYANGIQPTGFSQGMTLRDYFAAKVMQGLLANPKLADSIKQHGGAYSGWIEESAYGWADGLLKARSKNA